MSIITPAYNHAETIGPCLRSVWAQSMTSWEQIVIDDGSTDDTWRIVDKLALRDPRIVARRQTHRGIARLAETYNDALALCRGRYIAILEGDDCWPPDKLWRQTAIHVADEALVLSHGRAWSVRDGRIVGRYPEPPVQGRSSCQTYLRLALVRQSCIMPVSAVVSRDALHHIGGFAQSLELPAVDYPTWLALFARHPEGHVWFEPATLGYWRQSPTQVTQTYTVSTSQVVLRLALAQYDALRPGLRSVLGVDRAQITRAHWERNILPAQLRGLRQALVRRDRAEALRAAALLARRGKGRMRLEGWAGLCATLVGADLEPMFSLVDRWRPRADLSDAVARDAALVLQNVVMNGALAET